MRIHLTTLLLFLMAAPGLTGEEKPPPKIEPVSDAEKAKLLAAETPQQRALRAELAALAKMGQKIYYNSNFKGPQAIYVVGADGSGFARLTPEDWQDNQEYPHVSPDGKRIVFHTRRKMTKQECLELPFDPKYSPAEWTKGGARPRGAKIWMMNSDGTEARPVAMGSCPHWSPDGKHIAYGVQPRPNTRRLGLLDLAGKKEWVFQGRGGNTPCFSPDGTWYVGGAHYIESFKLEDITAGNGKPKGHWNSYGCNQEVSPDGKWLVHVTDGKEGSWINTYPYDPEKHRGSRGKAVDLGVPKDTMNYFPEFSPDTKYLVWGHWRTTEAWKTRKGNRYAATDAELYVTRWPPDGVNVRITWHGGTTQNPHWHRAAE